jgi:manganese-dependent inorganic pyrophosphatase
MKMYNAGGYPFAIAQAEVSDLYEVSERVDALNNALQYFRESNGLDFAMLMVTDVVRGSSRLLMTDSFPVILDELPYQPMQDGTRLAEGVVSRKKQLLPGILSLLEM